MGPNVMEQGAFSFFIIDVSKCEVGIQELPKNSSLGRLTGSLKASIETQDQFNERAMDSLLFCSNVKLDHHVFGACGSWSYTPDAIVNNRWLFKVLAGAGNDTTAAGILANILDIRDIFP
ncbi:Glyceraldehyde-3-phosphate dehydrogenase-like family protein [Quillaja saponaria]|uniref:Glyceraldehyde-3-phosphate dehydrogenase-like family protein n=1 Tax=Quillaja saponaria TaxID=32244 RepID=A0AAD7PMA0_QUISA|nr:Glyceraldehyde-3-phosphate dehydrogenase-like family protein [Quillaja saponaria]